MTLITVVCTNSWIALAADRRITATGAWQADADTKIALVDNEYLVSYTGAVPRLDGELDGALGFENWLHGGVLALKEGDLHDHLLGYLASDNYLRDRPFMLMVVSFRSTAFSRAPVPELVVLSNSMTEDGELIRDGAVHSFRMKRISMQTDGCVTYTTRGEDVAQQELRLHLEERLAGCSELNERTRPLLYGAIGDLYTAVEDQSRGVVGSAVLIATLTRTASGPPVLANVFRRSDGLLSDEFSPALLATSRRGAPPVIIMHASVQMGPDVTWGAHPHFPMTMDDPGSY